MHKPINIKEYDKYFPFFYVFDLVVLPFKWLSVFIRVLWFFVTLLFGLFSFIILSNIGTWKLYSVLNQTKRLIRPFCFFLLLLRYTCLNRLLDEYLLYTNNTIFVISVADTPFQSNISRIACGYSLYSL